MITFRKPTIASTACYVSPIRRVHRRGQAGRFAPLIILLLVASATASATPRPQKHVGKRKAAVPSTRAQAEQTKPIAKVPINVKRLDTPDGSGIIAIFGEYPSDLNEVGQAYLEREFFEHVVAGVLLLDGPPDSGTMIEVAMLPQEKNQREGDFIFGRLKGHIIVVVEKRRVIVTCIFTDAQNHPQQMIAVKAVEQPPGKLVLKFHQLQANGRVADVLSRVC